MGALIAVGSRVHTRTNGPWQAQPLAGSPRHIRVQMNSLGDPGESCLATEPEIILYLYCNLHNRSHRRNTSDTVKTIVHRALPSCLPACYWCSAFGVALSHFAGGYEKEKKTVVTTSTLYEWQDRSNNNRWISIVCFSAPN